MVTVFEALSINAYFIRLYRITSHLKVTPPAVNAAAMVQCHVASNALGTQPRLEQQRWSVKSPAAVKMVQ